jgi:histone deacetylase complex regulatory component SIN3
MSLKTPSRSQRREVRNPILNLPAAQELAMLLREHPDLSETFQRLLLQLSVQADQQAEHSWGSRKPPLAAYWRSLAVYARHIVRAIRCWNMASKAEK